MKSLKTMTLALGLSSIFALGACGGSELDKVEKFVDEICACKDAECTDKVGEKAKKSMDKETMEKLKKDKPEEMAKLMEKMMKCTMKHVPDMPAMPE
tara:strand:- start:66739 stop:67029 length:291 start_codon:yes stop_codon:yes gene_type:complete